MLCDGVPRRSSENVLSRLLTGGSDIHVSLREYAGEILCRYSLRVTACEVQSPSGSLKIRCLAGGIYFLPTGLDMDALGGGDSGDSSRLAGIIQMTPL